MLDRFASKLINYVEPVEYNGVFKTAFYTEFGTNFQIGDKVFIINGNYDSDTLITDSVYTMGTDGYKILDIDRCRIVLDINYTGNLVYNQDDIDNYAKLYTVSTQREFDYINAIKSNTYATYSSIFEYGLSNNFIYVNSGFSGTNSILAFNTGVSQSGFYQKKTSNNTWVNITATFSSGIFQFNTTGPGITYSLTYNNKVLVVGENITVATNSTFEQRGIYIYNNNKWTLDTTSNKSFIGKSNFRNGKFKGTWNEGVFGSYDQSINWDNLNAVWNSGIFINSNWVLGTINSKNTKNAQAYSYTNQLYNPSFPVAIPSSVNILTSQISTASRTIDYNTSVKQSDNTIIQSYYCQLDASGNPIQTTDFSNNKSYGFNYIIDSDIQSGSIINGNFENCNIGLTSYGINSIDVYYGLSFSYALQALGGNYNLCDINTAALYNANIMNSNILNSNILNSKLSSNQISNTVANGDYNSNNGINVINADLWSYLTTDSSQKRGVLKLFIDISELNRISSFETIYINRLNKEIYLSSYTDDEKVWLNYENKYIFDYFSNYDLTGNTSSIVVSFKMPSDNIYKSYIQKIGASFVNAYTYNTNQLASIDIDLAENLAWYTDGTSSFYLNNNQYITTDNVSNLFSNTQIDNSDFNSGILVNSNWISGDNVNDISNVVMKSGGSYSINIPSGSTNSLTVDISGAIYNKYSDYNIGDYVWINGLDYATASSTTVIPFSGTFKVKGITTSTFANARRLILTEQTNNIYLNSLTYSGFFEISKLIPNYFSISKFKIDGTTITSGLFKNTLILNSTILNNSFNNLDKTLTISNISKLRFINVLFKDDNNNINSGLVYNSHIVNTTWTNGISYNSFVYGNSFSNGIFKNGYWLNGVFNNGMFSDSTDVVTSTSSYELTSNYKSWRYGTFNNGQFYNSTWIDGIFNNGRLYSSTWYGGVWNNGILGIQNSQYYNTTMGYYPNLSVGTTSTTWNYGVVESAIIGGSSTVYWYDGKFNNGEFTSGGGSYSSTWYNGDFNGGKFDGYAKWKNGNFNKGKFLSYYGWQLSGSTNSSDYSWEYGMFNGGQFGYPSLGTNSTWFNGEFNDGSFYGRVWNYGIFIKGNFYGSATATVAPKTEYTFVNSFTGSYYGIWRDGYFVDSVHLGNPNEKIYTEIKRATDTKKATILANIQNALWLNGTFSHNSGTTNNIVWLNGSFYKGNFNNSAFNPFVDRTLFGYTSSNNFSFNYNDSCKWYNGTFNGGTFYISEWLNGLFQSGYMLGGIWRNGTWYYGTAENSYWEAGTWKNGNWDGTNFNSTTIGTSSQVVVDPLTINVLYNIANVIGTSSIHLLNAFTGSLSPEKLYDPAFTEEASGNYQGWTQSSGTDAGTWSWSTGFSYVVPSHPYSHIEFYTGDSYGFGGAGVSKTLFGLSQSGVTWTTNIYEPDISYNVSISIFVAYPSGIYTGYPTPVEIFLGYTSSILNCVNGVNNFNFNLLADSSLWTSYNPELGITKLSSVTNVNTYILSVSVKSTNISYDFIHNNSLYTPYGASPSLGATVSFPGLVLSTVAGGGVASLQYGNGKFVSGVWENGIWNNGWRDDTTLTKCQLYPIASYVRMSKNTHRIQLQFIDQNQSLFNSGDYASVGNIVSIDINGVRKLIKDKFKVIFVGTNNIVLEISLNYPIMEIIQDSDLHLIYLSKNVWLSGGFLNGYFNGIWNYGLFKGYPYLTYMKDSHWIDGIFDGGHFLSGSGSATFSSMGNYQTGLIQNFTFNDNNVAPPFRFLYQSWIDINYVITNQTNLYQDTNYYDGVGDFALDATLSKSNLNGFITYDVLSSNSSFRNGYDYSIKNFKLGSKYTKYVDYLNNTGGFNNMFTNDTSYASLDMSSFISDGWNVKSSIPNGGISTTFDINNPTGSNNDPFDSGISSLVTPYSGYGTMKFYSSDFKFTNIDNTLSISSANKVTLGTGATAYTWNTVIPTGTSNLYNIIRLNNYNTLNIPNQRYSMIEYTLLSFTGYPGPRPFTPRSFVNSPSQYIPPVINYGIAAATWSLCQMTSNPIFDPNPVKNEFFYNRHSLLFVIAATDYQGIGTDIDYGPYPVQLDIDNMHFYEVDMIPFFQYATESNIDHSIQLPWTAVAPFIDYTNSNFNYIGNISLTVTSDLISSSSSAVFSVPTSGGIFNPPIFVPSGRHI